MKSPFPGMDPYLEQYWRDVHHSLCTYAHDALQPQLMPALRARVEERLVVEDSAGGSRSIYPDAKIVERSPRGKPAGGGGTALAEPIVIRVESETATEGFIQIIDATTGGTLVTVIEFLSPSNKLSEKGRKQYLAKQEELTEARVSLVEVDLLREGEWIVQAPMNDCLRRASTHYRASAHRGCKPWEYEYYPLPIDQPLPAIRIPLRRQDADAHLNLQALIDQVYQNGGYDDIDYRRDPVPPLDEKAAAWAADLLRGAGKR